MNSKMFNVGLFAIIVIFAFVVEEASGQSYGPIGGTRPGECPTYNDTDDSTTEMKCPKPCQIDCECPKGQRCCRHPSCKLICVNPVNVIEPKPTCNATIARPTKPGICPNSDLVCKRCVDQCTSDCDCSETEICCLNKSCGNICSKPVILTSEPEPQPVDPTVM